MRMIQTILLLAIAVNGTSVISGSESESAPGLGNQTDIEMGKGDAERGHALEMGGGNSHQSHDKENSRDEENGSKEEEQESSRCCSARLRKFISYASVGFIGAAVLVSYADHHVRGLLNSHLVETISGTLATHPVWSKTVGSIGAAFGGVALWNLWNVSSKEAEGANTWENETSTCCAKALTRSTLSFWIIGSISQLGLLWFPIGGEQSGWHKMFLLPFFIPTAIGMVLYAWLSQRKYGLKNWRTYFLSLTALLMVAFAAMHFPVSEKKNQFKMTVEDCMREHPESANICQAESNRLDFDNKILNVNCRNDFPNYDAPYKKPCVKTSEFENLTDLAKATEICEAAKYEGEQCHISDLPMTGFHFGDVTTCDSPIKDLQGANDTCRNALARNTDGKIDNAALEANCASTKDIEGNTCEFKDPESGKWWSIWSVGEIVGWSASFCAFTRLLIWGI